MFDLLPSFGHLNPRLAAFLLMALIIGAAIPLALGWTKILPPEREPFARADLPAQKPKRDFVAIFLLCNVSLSLLLAIPRIAESLQLEALTKFLPPSWSEHLAMISLVWFSFIPAFAAAYSAVRANVLRMQLIAGGILVLALWLLSPTLLGSLSP